MKRGRLHAYEVLQRVAQVREMRASLAFAEASAEERSRRHRCDDIGVARDQVTAASRMDACESSRLDMARYEMLAELDAVLAQRQHEASQELTVAEKVSLERAEHSVRTKRYREQIDQRMARIRQGIDQRLSCGLREEAIELWLGCKPR